MTSRIHRIGSIRDFWAMIKTQKLSVPTPEPLSQELQRQSQHAEAHSPQDTLMQSVLITAALTHPAPGFVSAQTDILP